MLKISTVPPKKALSKAFLRERVTHDEIARFKTHFREMLARTETAVGKGESEENMKNIVGDFLKKTWFADRHELNTKEAEDLVIHTGKSAADPVGVIFETKKPDSREMLSPEKPNAKALHQLALYYLRERIEHKNIQVKHLVATDIHHWFVFDENLFDRHVFQNPAFRKGYDAYVQGEKNTDFFYKNVAEPAFAALDADWPCAHFDLRTFRKNLETDAPDEDLPLVALFKILSPTHLLKLPFANDSNSLDRNFYTELLHLIGLEEVKDAGKKIIRRKAQPDEFSLLENALSKIKVKGFGSFNAQNWGDTPDQQAEAVAFELCITWVNRILFLKLLEAQLIGYHRGDRAFRFLSSSVIHDFDRLYKVFFEVLAVKPEERKGRTATDFARIPYLNSSLFEITDLERLLGINELDNDEQLPLHRQTVLKTDKGERRAGTLPTLDYFLQFLDAYDFASEGTEAIQDSLRTLINASVLGLIFEKLNGYRDGSFFTPGFVTMYMCRQTIRRAVVDKFNQHFSWDCADFEALRDRLDFSKKDIREQANALVNALRICDPAVGSGHFLVSALNELIAVKSELGILCDRKGDRVKGYAVSIENDELFITDEESGEPFRYLLNEKNQPIAERQRLQETLFHEKQILIENCLFGVDINPNSVKICRLRLWIELLKNAYYTADSGFQNLETLPNIDINIKCGNSLVSRFPLSGQVKNPAQRKAFHEFIRHYKIDVWAYKNCVSKTDKAAIRGRLALYRSQFETFYDANDPDFKNWRKHQDLLLLKNSELPFGEDRDSWREQIRLLTMKTAELEAVWKQKDRSLFRDAFEWRFEFPEVLDDDGAFVGFDVVVGNPPYFSLSKIKDLAAYFENARYATYSKGADIYCLFFERGGQILRGDGLLHFITSNSWLRAIYGEPLKKYFRENAQPLALLNIENVQIFEEATVESNLLMFQKRPTAAAFPVCNLGADYVVGEPIAPYFSKNAFAFSMPETSDWVIGSQATAALKLKIEAGSKLLKEFKISMNRGITTGLNEAFILDEATKTRLETADPNSAELIKPILRGRDLKKYSHEFGQVYTICTFPSMKIDLEKYPAIKQHFLDFGKARLEQTGNPGSRKKTNNKWFETQDAIGYWKEFEQPKIIWGEISDKAKFSFDEDGFYAEATTFFMTGERLKFLLAVLNSQVSEWYFNQISTTTGMGTNRWKKYKIEMLPIKLPTPEQETALEALVTQILAAKKATPGADTSALEREVDGLVYGLYGLTGEEIGLVEGR